MHKKKTKMPMRKGMQKGMLLLSVFALTTFAGCSTVSISDSRYRADEVGVAKVVERCRVLSVRKVAIRPNEGTTNLGFLAGGIAGGTAGSGFGGDGTLGETLATQVGVVAGAFAGKAIAEKVGEREGLEYSILTNDGEEITFVQDHLDGEIIMRAGDTCRRQLSADGRNRILPTDGLLKSVDRPEEVTFN
ncbi:MAG: hypothetical protein OD811_06560 [Alphaproteobacteria bacterium]